ncbi:relaxase/mobilization nuclease domain-containing protein [Alicyclobacillus fodiniaquatilis]|uniref:Relaxase/mobilization nuclease domain-containing protein n=1 Tax=Alicyclobacillus fodiniaquatilis TaxID=1661150 RepID=A0ABW4JBF5_9BACL
MTAHVKSLGFYKHGATSKPLSKAKANIKYISADHERHENKPELFSKDEDRVHRQDVYQKLQEQPERGVVAHKLVLTVSEDERNRLNLDMRELVRDTMNRYEMRNGQNLDWVAAVHDDKGHPHAHILIRGYDQDNKQVGIYPRHIKDFQEIAEQEKNRQVERHRERQPERGHTREKDRDVFREMHQELGERYDGKHGQQRAQTPLMRGTEEQSRPLKRVDERFGREPSLER